jgi:CRP-like cAMP-binding protein
MPLPENRLLAALPPADRDRLIAGMTEVTFEHREVAYRANGPINYVYFPRSGIISSVVIMLDGATAEVAAVGMEGMIGLPVFMGATRCPEEVFCQIAPATCRRMPAAEFAAEVARGGSLRDVIYAYTRVVLTSTSRLVACNALHPVNGRCARWLLTCRDRVASDEFPLTQEFLATMLGVRRATVTAAAGALQADGLISYRHGHIKILDGPGLEKTACECYEVTRQETQAT